ncbi:MAG: gamma-glutamylcyclotransferase [Ruaniaceae bacterium]|nr:gamma-glutamylcyclotransferase [Ruaniaceae bacterium]
MKLRLLVSGALVGVLVIGTPTAATSTPARGSSFGVENAIDAGSASFAERAVRSSARSGWFFEGDAWYYANAHGGVRANEWLWDGAWYYLGEGGTMATGWLVRPEGRYFLNSSGQMRVGWVKTENKWYYFAANGLMRTGWVSVAGTWYYLNADGEMRTGWVYVGGAWFYLAQSGAMAMGWVWTGGAWYYLTQSGAMATGWLQNGAKWYYLTQSGAMVTGRHVVEGRASLFDDGGVWLGYESGHHQASAVFAYGTLRTGERNHGYLSGSYASTALTSMDGLALYRMSGYTAPWAVEQSGYVTKGEVFWLHPATATKTITILDRLERYDSTQPPENQSYVRVMRPMVEGPLSWVYVAGPRTAKWLKSGGSLIPFGDWKRR